MTETLFVSQDRTSSFIGRKCQLYQVSKLSHELRVAESGSLQIPVDCSPGPQIPSLHSRLRTRCIQFRTTAFSHSLRTWNLALFHIANRMPRNLMPESSPTRTRQNSFTVRHLETRNSRLKAFRLRCSSEKWIACSEECAEATLFFSGSSEPSLILLAWFSFFSIYYLVPFPNFKGNLSIPSHTSSYLTSSTFRKPPTHSLIYSKLHMVSSLHRLMRLRTKLTSSPFMIYLL